MTSVPSSFAAKKCASSPAPTMAGAALLFLAVSFLAPGPAFAEGEVGAESAVPSGADMPRAEAGSARTGADLPGTGAEATSQLVTNPYDVGVARPWEDQVRTEALDPERPSVAGHPGVGLRQYPRTSPPVPGYEPPHKPPVEPLPDPEEAAAPKEPSETWPFKHFFDHINVRGYTQLRFNQLGATNDRLVNVQGDRSMGGTGGFFFRRIRMIFFGNVHPQIYVYLQPDFASAPSGSTLHFTQLRDWYFDLSDPSTEFRVRVGQSKVPFGFENMQSSQNRLPLDRSDPINSAAANERDIGLFFYFAPVEVRRRFKYLVDSGLKGSGDYGMVGLGVYNGQTANRPELNENKHVVARVTYPFLLGQQFLELGAGGYAGKFVVQKDPIVGGPDEFRDARVHASFVLYPQPFGLQIEYNVGIGPEFRALPTTGEDELIGEVREARLHGGYALASLKLGNFIPYARAMLYEGGKKHETNAPKYSVRELEMGIEWHIVKALELVGAYTIADRTFPQPPFQQEFGRLARFQLQINY